jgi:hypothetical protein
MPVGLNYGNSDYDSLKAELKTIIPSLTTNWTDFNDSDVSMTLVDLMTRLGDYASYRRDKIVRELLIPRARERKNVKALLSLIGYKMHNYISNTCEATISLPLGPHTNDIYIPAYTNFSIESDEAGVNYSFSNLQDVTLYEGESSRDFLLTQGDVVTRDFRLSDIVEGRLYLPDQKIAMNSISLQTISVTGDVVDWEEVDDIVQVAEAGNFFSHDTSDEYAEYIDIYPVYQSLVTESSTIRVTYLVTLGKDGYVGANKVVIMNSPIYDYGGFDMREKLSLTNTTIAAGGSDPEDINTAKRNSKIAVKTMDTIVTLEDYRDIIETHPSVLKCKALDINSTITGITQGYIVNVYVVPREGYVVDEDYKRRILSYIEPKRMTGIVVNILEAGKVSVNPTVSMYIKKTSLYKDRAKTACEDALLNFFNQEDL